MHALLIDGLDKVLCGMHKSLIIETFFLTAIWLPHSQLWAIIEEAVLLTQCYSLAFYIVLQMKRK